MNLDITDKKSYKFKENEVENYIKYYQNELIEITLGYWKLLSENDNYERKIYNDQYTPPKIIGFEYENIIDENKKDYRTILFKDGIKLIYKYIFPICNKCTESNIEQIEKRKIDINVLLLLLTQLKYDQNKTYLKPGDRVFHEHFGKGTVIFFDGVNGTSPNSTVMVQTDDMSINRGEPSSISQRYLKKIGQVNCYKCNDTGSFKKIVPSGSVTYKCNCRNNSNKKKYSY